jgi:hypothetical protein
MKRRDLEHVIRTAADIADDDEIVVIGSQAILGQHPDAPAELCVSTEADVYPKNRPERAELIDGSIGEGWVRGHVRRPVRLTRAHGSRAKSDVPPRARRPCGRGMSPDPRALSGKQAGECRLARAPRRGCIRIHVAPHTRAERHAGASMSLRIRERCDIPALECRPTSS